MTAFIRSACARSSIKRSSAIAEAWLKPVCVGQSMLATVATQSPRNSRGITGGSAAGGGGGGGGGGPGGAGPVALPPEHAAPTSTAATTTKRRKAIANHHNQPGESPDESLPVVHFTSRDTDGPTCVPNQLTVIPCAHMIGPPMRNRNTVTKLSRVRIIAVVPILEAPRGCAAFPAVFATAAVSSGPADFTLRIGRAGPT